MEFGMFHESPWSRGQTESETFDPSFEQIDAAERCGLDVMWLAELHTVPTRSVLSAPLDVTTAIATRTSRIKIGTAVQVRPLCHPLRIAEEAATVDQISHGRLIFGVGRSGFPRTYQAYRLRRKPRRLCRDARHHQTGMPVPKPAALAGQDRTRENVPLLEEGDPVK